MTTPSVLVRQEVGRFLKSPDPEVLCISGAWGVGKTHLWKEIVVETAKAEPAPPFLNYSYVSLFGVDKLEDLRLSIFANRISLAEGRLARYSQGLISKAKTAQSLLEQIPKVGPLFKTLGGMYFSSVRRMLICIDDLDRRSKNLDIKDVLGLISYLKEERRCKIAVLLNDGELGAGEEDFRTHFEKTIDAHLVFEPTAEESTAIAFPDPDDLQRQIKEHCITLGIRNIRIIKKIERATGALMIHLRDFDAEIQRSAVRSMVLLNWSILKGTGAPSLEYLRRRTGLTAYNMDKEKEVPREEAEWNLLLDRFQWGSLDDLDRQLINSIQDGYFDPHEINRAATEVWRRLDLQRQDGKFEDAWKWYHESFDNNGDEVLDTIYSSFKQTYRTITFLNLDGTVRLFRELGRSDQADELLKFYIENRDEPQSFWDLDSQAFGGDVKDPGVREAIAQKFRSFGATQVDVAALLEAMGSNKGWNMSDIDAVAALPVDEYKKLFKEKRGRELRRIVNGGLVARRVANPTEGMQRITGNTISALREIAAESGINARRIANLYGISVEPPDADSQ